MDGLECSEICLQQIKSEGCRIDAEYYSKQNLRLQKIVDSAGNKTISEYGGKLDCSAFYPSITKYYSNDRGNVPFIRVNEIENGLVSITNNTVFLPLSLLKENSKTIALAYPGDIIIAKGGNTLAKVGLVTDEFPIYATCRDVIILRTSELQGLNKYYLWAFLHSTYGQGILWRSASQTGQPHLTLPTITKIKVPDIKVLQREIENLYMRSVSIKNISNQLYADAKKILYTSLKQPTETVRSLAVSERLKSQSFAITGRLDAEYYQPKYDEYLKKLHEFETTTIPKEYDVFKNSGVNYANGVSDVGVIKTKQLGNDGVNIDGIESYFNYETCTLNKSIFVKYGDVIFASMGVGSLGKVGLFMVDGNKNYVTDSTLRIYRTKPKCRVHPEVLCIFLQSEIGQELIYRYVVGSTGIISIYDSDMAKIPIPIFDEDMQNELTTKVQESFALRKKSKQLLEYAKQAVELAIEQGEDVAMNWLRNKLPDTEV